MTKETNSRDIILDVLLEILEKGGYSHLILRQALEKYQYLEKPDRAFITRVCEGTIEYLIQIDAVINRYSKVKVKKMKPVIRTILRMSVYQLLYMERVPDSAVCNEAVKLAEKRKFQGLKGFVNGVLRTIAREKDSLEFDDPSLRYSMPEWMFTMWTDTYGREKAEQIAASFLKERPLTVRINESLADKKKVMDSLLSQKILVEESGLMDSVLFLSGYDYPEQIEAFQNGWITVQDLSSALAAQAASLKPGDFVLDVCSAPGGKSLHAADLLKGSGMVEARDLTEYKTAMVEENIRRTGFQNIRTKVWDARVFDETMEEKADVVLADLPCSGLGIIGKKPDIKLRVKEQDTAELAGLQREILAVASRYVKPGGTLINSTCTISKKENEENAAWILKELPFREKKLSSLLPEALARDCVGGHIQILPGSYSCDGFFIAAFVKTERK